jgi:branched-subunit amino acid aminotransferase/4-amino-4-deoxychorismate lyase
VPASQAQLPVYDAGVVQGATVTEMVRTFRLRPYRLAEHLERLFRSLRYTRLEIGLSSGQLEQIANDLIAHNGSLLDAGGDLGLNLFVTAGDAPLYQGMTGRRPRPEPTVCVHTFPLPFGLWARRMETGAHLITPSIRQLPAQCCDPQMKCRSRMHYYLADREAQQVEPEAFALLLDLNGNVTETSGANFLMVECGAILSPPMVDTLAGISRATVIDLAAKMGIPFRERTIGVLSAMNAEEAFLAGTPYCLMPVTRLNGVAIGGGRPGPIYRRLLETWSTEVELDIRQQILQGGRSG